MTPSSLPWYVAVGASGAEGLQDIFDLLTEMPITCNAVFLVVIHRPSDSTSDLLNVLQQRVSLPVKIAAEAEPLRPGVCYIGEPAELLTLASHGHAAMVNGRGNVFRNRTADLLFDSVAHFARERAIGIVLSGALDDGSRGLASIHDCGGVTMVLEPGAKQRGMQQNAIDYEDAINVVGDSKALVNAIKRTIRDSLDKV